MRVSVFTTNNPSMYSGGRYLSLVIAEALAVASDVSYVTNNKPIFYEDFINYPQHKNVNLCLTHDFSQGLPVGDFDVVVLIPSSTKDPSFYLKVRLFCAERNAKLVLFNFESPNWFNSLSPESRDEGYWQHWKNSCEDGALVLSMAQEGTGFAREFYTEYPDRVSFDTWYPVINSIEADRVMEGKRFKRIIIITRASDSHKGAQDFFDFLSRGFTGYTFVFLIGTKDVDSGFSEKMHALADKFNFMVEFKHQLNDYDKFVEIKKAQLMLFPSYFEGYGYPPVEAAYCNTPCLAYDLPVLRETCGDSIYYVDRGDIGSFTAKALEILSKGDENLKITKKFVEEKVVFFVGAKKLQKIISDYAASDAYAANSTTIVKIREIIEESVGLKKTPPSILQSGLLKKLKYLFSYKPFLCGVGKTDVVDNELTIKGYSLFKKKIDRVVLIKEGVVLGVTECNVFRNDVYNKYPKYNDLNSGFIFQAHIPNRTEQQPLDLNLEFYCENSLVGQKKIRLGY